MSRIYFHSPSDDVEVSGTERAWMGRLADDIGMATVDGRLLRDIAGWCDISIYGKVGAWITPDTALADQFRLAARYSGFDDYDGGSERCRFAYQGQALRPGSISINTALAVGSPAVQLATRLDSQCEIHAWVDGPNRAWLADLIDVGLATRVFRATPGRTGGWAAVSAFLRDRDDEPVVTSYSVCDQFPDSTASTWTPDPDADENDPYEAWGDLAYEQQWAYGMEWLRAQPGRLELVPADFGPGTDFHFGGNNLTWFDFQQWDAEDRVRAALGITGPVDA